MGYEMVTRTNRSFWEVTSAMQNSIRKGDYDTAGYCVWELMPQYEGYMRKRFLVISAEDCFGVITKEILHLTSLPGSENVEKALAVLCKAKKNRDADYFVCNLMHGVVPETMKKEQMSAELISAIHNVDAEKAGLYCNALFKKNRKFLWNTLHEMVRISRPELVDEFKALNEANEKVSKPSEETIFVAKAIVLMWTKKDTLACREMRYDSVLDPSEVILPKPVEECPRIKGYFPDWAYNWHTYHGKYDLKRDAIHAISNDQKLLTPLEENLFDDCTWNADINACLRKWNPRRVPLPYDDGKRKPEEKYPGKKDEPQQRFAEAEQMDLFSF